MWTGLDYFVRVDTGSQIHFMSDSLASPLVIAPRMETAQSQLALFRDGLQWLSTAEVAKKGTRKIDWKPSAINNILLLLLLLLFTAQRLHWRFR